MEIIFFNIGILIVAFASVSPNQTHYNGQRYGQAAFLTLMGVLMCLATAFYYK